MNKNSQLFKQPLKVVNIGLETFYEALVTQGVPAAHVEWKPPAGGNEKLLAILDKLK